MGKTLSSDSQSRILVRILDTLEAFFAHLVEGMLPQKRIPRCKMGILHAVEGGRCEGQCMAMRIGPNPYPYPFSRIWILKKDQSGPDSDLRKIPGPAYLDLFYFLYIKYI